MTEPTVFVVDDDPAMRKSLQWLTESVGLAVETFANAEVFLQSYTPDRAGCMVLDVRMPGMSGLDLQEQMQSLGCTLPVIIVTGHGEVQSAVRAMQSGAVHFIEKPFSDQELLDTIRTAIEQDRDTRQRRAERDEASARHERLTPREKEVLQLVIAGCANKQIAATLNISQKTVEVHRAHVMRKLEAQSVADLVRSSLLLDPEMARPGAADEIMSRVIT